MKNYIPDVHDVGMSATFPMPAILYYNDDVFSVVVFDQLDFVIDIVHFDHDSIDEPEIEGVEVTSDKIYFVDIVFYDVFFSIVNLRSVKELGKSVNEYMTETSRQNRNFMSDLLKECKELEVIKNYN